MIQLHLHKYIINLFLTIKSNIIKMLSDKYLFIQPENNYHNLITDIIHILNETVCNLENVYYKYFLYPKLQSVKTET